MAIEWLCRCPEELGDEFWPPNQTKRRAKSTPATSTRSTEQNELSESLLTEDGKMTEQQQQLPVREVDTGGGGNAANHEDQAQGSVLQTVSEDADPSSMAGDGNLCPVGLMILGMEVGWSWRMVEVEIR